MLATLVVTDLRDDTLANLAGDGQLSLREAVEAANTDTSVDGSPAGSGADEIVFAPGLRGELPLVNSSLVLADDVTIRGPLTDFDFGIRIDGDRKVQLIAIDPAVNVTIENLFLDSGSAFQGAAIDNRGNLVLRNMTIQSSTASTAGGGLYNTGTVEIYNSTIAGNTGGNAGGGGIYNLGTMTVVNSTLSRNQTIANGGGIRNAGGTAVFVSSTIAENRSDTDGDLQHSGGGIWIGNSTTVTLFNTVVAGNLTGGFATNNQTPNDIGENDVEAASAHNLIGDPATAGGLVEGTRGNRIGDGNGNLLPFGNIASGVTLIRGGSTRIYELVPGSRAINAGNNILATTPGADGIPGNGDLGETALKNDQRGKPFNRIANAIIDIGSYERQTLPVSFFVVNTTADERDYDNAAVSLREAINSANGSIGSETITFDAAVFDPAGSHTIALEHDQLSLFGVDSVTIEGPGKEALTLAGQNQVRVLYWDFGDTGNLTLRGLEITGGRTTGNDLRGDGPGLRFLSEGLLTIEDSTITGNTAVGSDAIGGGVYSYGSVVLKNSEITNNRSTSTGGGLYTLGELTVTDSVITGNSGDSHGGGLWASDTTTIRRSTISDNTSGGNGGGVLSSFGNITIVESTVSGNSAAGEGGGILGLYDIKLTGSTISGNTAGTMGGGFSTYGGEITLTGATISGNSAGTHGGGFYFDDSVTRVINSTVTGNAASGRGGGIAIFADGLGERLQIVNSIVAENTDDGTAPDFQPPANPATNLEVKNSLIGDRRGTTLAESQTPDPTTGNLVGDPTGGGLINPMLGPLRDNGGWTQTRAAEPGSPVIDSGSDLLVPADVEDIDGDSDVNESLPLDQRHLPRMNGTVDMGSVEYYELDFGDAGPGFPVSLADNGAHHGVTGPRLGALRDFESDGVNSAAADHDNTTGSDDEDGVMFGTIQVGATMAGVNIDLQNATDGRIDAWLDFDGNGNWDDDEQILTGAPVIGGLQTLNINLPATLQSGERFARVRLSTAGNLAATGYSIDGEVEDYVVTILPPPQVESVVINGGDAQRSSLDQVTVTFDRVVEIDTTGGQPFQFTHRDTGAAIASTHVVSESGGKTIVDFSFTESTPGVTSFGSLEDGAYRLKIVGALISSEGVLLDGDRDGAPGGDHDFAPVDSFYRKYGDINGNQLVEMMDFEWFRAAFGKSIGEDGYIDGFDSDGDNRVALIDFAKFRRNYGT